MALDSKSKKEIGIILILAPVFLFLLWNNLIVPQVKRHQAIREAKLRAAEFTQQTTEVQQQTLTRAEEMLKFAEMTWGRNPFLQPGINSVRPPVGSDKPSVAPKFNLEGIVWDKDFPYAIINGEVWQIGDEVGGYRVQSISKETVTLESNGQTIELKLFADLW